VGKLLQELIALILPDYNVSKYLDISVTEDVF
jgi:hypothetical protein